jgi:HPt (histidine-containing phosphotransfer) domain-containing protein
MDLEAAAGELGLERDGFLELLTLFLDTAAGDLASLKAAVGAGDAKTAAVAAHSLKGAALNLGFMELGHAAREVEVAAKGARLADAGEHLVALEGKLQDLAQACRP